MASHTYRQGPVVSREMRELLAQPGYISIRKGAQRLRKLYTINSCAFNITILDPFPLACYVGNLDAVKEAIESGNAPDLKGTETAFEFGYATLVIAGAQRVTTSNGSPMHHHATLSYLLSCGLPPDIPDIVGSIALHHATMNHMAKLDLARLLLTHGANVNRQDRYGAVPLLGAMQSNQVGAVELLMEFGADVRIADADGTVPESFALRCGAQVTAAMQKWLRKRAGTEAPMEEKKCDRCGARAGKDLGSEVKLKMCSQCRTMWYCSTECQKVHWKTHKVNCRPFSEDNTVTLVPSYHPSELMSLADLTRKLTGVATSDPKTTWVSPPKSKVVSKSMVVKIQAPWSPDGPVDHDETPLLIYNKKRDFVCYVERSHDPASYDKVEDVIRKRGVGGAKGYFPAELETPEKLVVKIDQILAEQPF